jgi:uncharacterized protein (TIGR00288 family)
MNQTETRGTRIAVFIDFDNVEIGVKSTIGGQFDIGLVLEAIKERGEIVTKIAYSDWKRAGDYSRILTQHAIRMVQRNLTPGGDKNGADITMALDALEMAFTHDHINAFVIVGGDSDFISLVEKLKQYGRKVIVVGGRQFTSATMQKNCHEFIAYENLAGSRGRSSERGRSGGAHVGATAIAQVLPLVKRALKVLSEREVTPQLGLLKSTLLQLDSTFSEREYGASSFRDFMEKVAQAGAVTLKHAGRSMLVEAREDGGGDEDLGSSAPALTASAPAPAGVGVQAPAPAAAAPPPRRAAPESTAFVDDDSEEDESLPPSPMSMQDGIKAVQRAFNEAVPPPRWPMYVRQAKQFLRNAIETFDERKYGFASVVDLLRAAGKEGVVRIERDRQGAVRVFPGNNLTPKTVHTGLPMDDEDDDGGETATGVVVDEPIADVDGDVDMSAPLPAEEELPATAPMVFAAAETVTEPPIVDAEPVGTDDDSEGDEVNGNRIDIEPSRTISKRKTTSRRTSTTGRVTARAPRVTKTPTRARKTGGRK